MLIAFLRFLNKLIAHRSAMSELSHMSSRELADIGLTRADLPRVMSGNAVR